MLLTVGGAEYFLGFHGESGPEQRAAQNAHELSKEESAALGLADEQEDGMLPVFERV